MRRMPDPHAPLTPASRASTLPSLIFSLLFQLQLLFDIGGRLSDTKLDCHALSGLPMDAAVPATRYTTVNDVDIGAHPEAKVRSCCAVSCARAVLVLCSCLCSCSCSESCSCCAVLCCAVLCCAVLCAVCCVLTVLCRCCVLYVCCAVSCCVLFFAVQVLVSVLVLSSARARARAHALCSCWCSCLCSWSCSAVLVLCSCCARAMLVLCCAVQACCSSC